MPPDPVLVADARAWLVRAAADLRAADVDLAALPPLLEDALFHSQQAVEKAFKAFLTFHLQPFRRTHSLEEIGAACLALDASLRPTVGETAPLSEYAWAYRHPGPAMAPDRVEAEQTRAIAQRSYQAILARLPEVVHP
ncbi:MAG: HEPN domain-containing protein [Chloroflexi bacterium]|nr:HEPN domain-containing protein [Chloroflexota bacterium]